jgi:hypothetical protein
VGVPTRDQEQGQVPRAPEEPEDNTSHQRTVQPLQPGQGETASPYLLRAALVQHRLI